MSQPRVFISSTYADLRDLRSVLGEFFESRNWLVTLFERGGITYGPDAPVAEACCDAVEESDMFVLILGGRYGSPSDPARKRTSVGRYNSITKDEYLAAKEAHIPMFVFIQRDVAVEFDTWLRNDPKTRNSASWVQVDDVAMYHLLGDILELRRGNVVYRYETVSDITKTLNEQLAGWTGEWLTRHRADSIAVVPVNAYKLFFFRVEQGLSRRELAELTGLKATKIKQLETVRNTKRERLGPGLFRTCSPKEIDALEAALGCEGHLRAGRDDDFLSLYIHFYHTYRKKRATRQRRPRSELAAHPTRVVVFDFDGTLTVRDQDETTWERIWVSLGYSARECAYYHRQFSDHAITHREWCDITRDHFRDRGLTRQQLVEIAGEMALLDDVGEVLHELRGRGIELYVLSGSIRDVIKKALGDLYELFVEVHANDLVFGDDGVLSHIVGTRYDFEGKAEFIRGIIDRGAYSALEVLFVGNSCNDVFASRSGARTLCINPHLTDPNVLEHWTYYLKDVVSLRDIMSVVGD